MQVDLETDDSTDDAAEPVAPGTSCSCLPPTCYCQSIAPTACDPQY